LSTLQSLMFLPFIQKKGGSPSTAARTTVLRYGLRVMAGRSALDVGIEGLPNLPQIAGYNGCAVPKAQDTLNHGLLPVPPH
jgi:hypothetical protein